MVDTSDGIVLHDQADNQLEEAKNRGRKPNSPILFCGKTAKTAKVLALLAQPKKPPGL
jgi:hypothetical protein